MLSQAAKTHNKRKWCGLISIDPESENSAQGRRIAGGGNEYFFFLKSPRAPTLKVKLSALKVTFQVRSVECTWYFSPPFPFSVRLDHIWWVRHVLDGYSDSECISRTLYLYLKIFKAILMGLWTDKCDVTHHCSLNYPRVTFLSYRFWRSRQQRTRLQNGATFAVPVFCCIHGFNSSSNALWKGRKNSTR